MTVTEMRLWLDIVGWEYSIYKRKKLFRSWKSDTVWKCMSNLRGIQSPRWTLDVTPDVTCSDQRTLCLLSVKAVSAGL